MFFEALALVTSIMNALGVVLIAKGMKDSKPIVAAFYSVVVQTLILTAILLTRLPQLNMVAVRFFVLGGVLSLGVARLLNFVAIRRIGVAKTSALIGSSPVITTLLSIAILSETPGISTILGAVTVAAGVILISGAVGFKIERSLLVGLASALAYSFSNVISKSGITIQPDPFLSAQVGASGGLLFIAAYLTATGQTRDLKISRPSLGYFTATGILSSVGWLAMMKALETGPVSVVTTIVYSYPLFALLFTHIMLRDEKLTVRIALGSVLVVAGVAIVAFF